ncbi:uncharacterized protein LOC121602303 [Anopheles merus]|uniref:uncharacterized protein LOC121602303 n=1 Tax=Anopheles merus TaxID=30066 RepID=UPI001BE4931F|nr:uncharacterized protein LOC121602303 [Anopheles merus]
MHSQTHPKDTFAVGKSSGVKPTKAFLITNHKHKHSGNLRHGCCGLSPAERLIKINTRNLGLVVMSPYLHQNVIQDVSKSHYHHRKTQPGHTFHGHCVCERGFLRFTDPDPGPELAAVLPVGAVLQEGSLSSSPLLAGKRTMSRMPQSRTFWACQSWHMSRFG